MNKTSKHVSKTIHLNSEVANDPSDWERAVDLFESGDGPGAMFLLRKILADGNPYAMTEIANLYEIGSCGIDLDHVKAIFWYKKAIKACNDKLAHVGLGRIYYRGEGVEKDYAAAYRHFKEAEDRPGVACAIGQLYVRGLGVEKDFSEANRYFNYAISKGNILAYKHQGFLYLRKLYIIKAFVSFKNFYAGVTHIVKTGEGYDRLMVK